MNHYERAEFTRDIYKLAIVTQSGDWATEGEVGTMDPSKMAKAIVPKKWGTALNLAVGIGQSHPYLPVPVPGGDPAGFVWLTWEKAPYKVAAEIHDTFIAWTMRTDTSETRHRTSVPREFVESLAATFPRVTLT